MSEALVGDALPMRTYIPGPNGDGATIEEGEYVVNGDDIHHMNNALWHAESAGMEGDNAVGCTLVVPDVIALSTGTREFRDKHLAHHAEELGYDAIQPHVGRDLSRTTAYCTAEPCFGCAYRFDKGSLGRLFIAATKADAPEFFRNPDTLDHIWRTTRRTLTVVTGLQTERSVELLTRYRKKH
jgi:tRNA(Arg) A34 adenosine deaminase TadA